MLELPKALFKKINIYIANTLISVVRVVKWSNKQKGNHVFHFCRNQHKKIDGVNIIQINKHTFILRSWTYDIHFSNNNTYDTSIAPCKGYRSLVKKVTNKLNNLVPPFVNGSKFENISIISRNSIKGNHEIFRLRNLNINLRRKITRLSNEERLKKLG